MGLPQVSSSKIAEEVTASFSAFVQSPPHFHGMSSCDMSGMHVGQLGSRIQEEVSREVDIPSMQNNLPLHRLRFSSTEKNALFTHKVGQQIQPAVSRIVGFESKAGNSSAFAFDGNLTDSVHSSTVISRVSNGTETNTSLVRKRLMSPLNGVILPNQFDGESLDLGNSIYKNGCQSHCDKHIITAIQEHKKANIGNSSCLSSLIWSTSSFPQYRNSEHGILGANSCFLTDGPLLENKDSRSLDTFSSSLGVDRIEETSEIRSPISPIAIPPRKVVSSPLSLSPLGPKFVGRIKPSGGCRSNTKELDDSYLTLKDMELSLDGTISDILTFHREEDCIMARKPLLVSDLVPKLDQGTPESMIEMVGDWGPDSNLSSQAKLGRTLSGLQVRRSLVGSFEESLLSGRLASGIVSQKIDGFLAVLNITGGNFSPHPQKLPFSVTCVDGDNFLLYYSSIDLAGNLPSSKSKSPKMKRSLSNDDSQVEKSHTRIPMKGRIQLVLSNPEKTPIHTFFCNYDLSDMPAGTKVLKMHQDFVLLDKLPNIRTMCMKYSFCTAIKTFLRQKVTLASSTPASRPGNGGRRDPQMNSIKSGKGSGESNMSRSMETCSESNSSIISSTKANKNCNSSGVLRYALHLRFLCPLPKKNSRTMQRCKSDPCSSPARNNTNTGGNRRFYLYNDMKVVFPQRHSDADEGKLHVEYHFPSDPKYYDISD